MPAGEWTGPDGNIYTTDNTALPPRILPPGIGDVTIPEPNPKPYTLNNNTSYPPPKIWPETHAPRKMPFGTISYFSWDEQRICIFGKCGALICTCMEPYNFLLTLECWQINDGITFTWNTCKNKHSSEDEMSLECFCCLVTILEATVNFMLRGITDEERDKVLLLP